jgi:hypothetical protein
MALTDSTLMLKVCLLFTVCAHSSKEKEINLYFEGMAKCSPNEGCQSIITNMKNIASFEVK